MALVTYLVQKTNFGAVLNDVTQVFIALDDAVVTTSALVRQATVNALRARGMTLPDGYFDQSTTVASKFNNVGDLFVIGQSGLVILDFDNVGAPAATGTRVTNLVQRTGLATVLNNVTQVFIAVDNAVATTPVLVRQTAVTALRAQGLALPDGYFDQATAVSLKFNDVGDLFVVGQSGLVLFDFDASSTPPVVGTNGGVVEADLGATYRYTFTPATFTGTTPITVTPIFTVDGVDATGSLISNVFTYTKDGSTHALSIRWSATNAFGGPVLSNPITRTIPAFSVSGVAPSITAKTYDTVTYELGAGVTGLTLDGTNVLPGMVGTTYTAARIDNAQRALVVTRAAGTETVTVPERALVVGYLGQSNINYGLNPVTNSSGYTKPAIATVNSRFVDYNEATTLDVTQAASLAGDINVGVANMSVWLNYIAPGKKVIFVSLAQSGTTFLSLMNDADDVGNRAWAPTADTVAYVEANHAPVDLLVEWWYTGVVNQIENKLSSHLPGYIKETEAGTPFVLGSTHISTPIDHTLWDADAPLWEKGDGIFSRGWTKWTYIRNHDKDSSEAAHVGIEAFWNDPRIQVFAAPQGTWGGHYANDSAHAIQDDPDGQVQLSWAMAIPVARALGVTINEPEYVGIEVAADGSYADLLVSLPNGGTLSTQRIVESRAAATNPKSFQQPVSGLEIERFGSGLARSPVHRLGETVFDKQINTRPAVFSDLLRGTVTISDTGSGSPRRGRIRITPEKPFANGDRIVPRHLYNENPYPQTFDPDVDPDADLSQKIWLDFPLERVESLRDPAALYKFPGVPVRPYGPIQTISGVGGAPYVFVPRSVVMTGTNGRVKSPLASVLYAGTEGMASVWFKNNDPAWASNRVLFQLRNNSGVTRAELITASGGRLSAAISGAGMPSSPPGMFTAGIWQHALLSWKTGVGGWAQYSANGAAPLIGTGQIDPNLLLIRAEGTGRVGFGASSGGSTGMLADVGHLYLNLTQALDLTDPANRAKFISTGGDPVSLGQFGQLPTGTPPHFYFDGDGDGWSNSGTGESIPLVGTLAVGSTPLLGSP